MDFPVKNDFFTAIPFTQQEQIGLLSIVEESVRAVRKVIDDKHWKEQSCKHKEVTLSKLDCLDDRDFGVDHAQGPCPCLIMRSSTYVSGTLNDVLEAISAPKTEEFRKAMSFIHKNRFLDGICLHSMLLPDGEFSSHSTPAFASIKWIAFNDGKAYNSPTYPTGTDYLYVEYTGISQPAQTEETAAHLSGTFGFCVQESIVREREVPNLSGFGLRRGDCHRTGLIVLPTSREDVVQVFSVIQKKILPHHLNPKNSANPQVAFEKIMTRRVTAIRKLDTLLERSRLSRLEFVKRSMWISDDQRKACAVCMRSFAALRRKHHCRICGEVVCSTCAPLRQFVLQEDGPQQSQSHKSKKQARICTFCTVKARISRQERRFSATRRQLDDQEGSATENYLYQVRSTISSQRSTNSAHRLADKGIYLLRDIDNTRFVSSMASSFSIYKETSDLYESSDLASDVDGGSAIYSTISSKYLPDDGESSLLSDCSCSDTFSVFDDSRSVCSASESSFHAPSGRIARSVSQPNDIEPPFDVWDSDDPEEAAFDRNTTKKLFASPNQSNNADGGFYNLLDFEKINLIDPKAIDQEPNASIAADEVRI
uniref:Uncharacterized protein AlNc14C4G648 n=1 Tax=Albugo laibachii Nc14 TaxID=890382 RepID=F0W0K7_9STRA|nr:conserved hypothetical protein [Albugo laibachii Nc14]|eukprot:CCA14579.1 conserved hypothetical protein [Albugo laibachii Nc14]